MFLELIRFIATMGVVDKFKFYVVVNGKQLEVVKVLEWNGFSITCVTTQVGLATISVEAIAIWSLDEDEEKRYLRVAERFEDVTGEKLVDIPSKEIHRKFINFVKEVGPESIE